MINNRSTLQLKPRIWIYIFSLFLVVLAILLVIASLFDWQISNLLAKPFLKTDTYFSTNAFAQLIEVIGTFPLMLMASIACWIFYFNTKYRFRKNVYTSIVRLLFVLLALFCVWEEIYNCEFYQLFLIINNTNYPTGFRWLIISLSMLISLVVNCIVWLIIRKINIDNIKFLLNWALVIVLVIISAQILVESIKIYIPRERFRTIMIDNTIPNDNKFGAFRPWYSLMWNPSSPHSFNNPFVNEKYITDGFKSFPSAHSSYAATIYPFIFLPFVLPKFNNRKWITFLVIVPVSIVGLIAFGRILAGAHYMSDTIIGGTIPFLASFVGYWIFIQWKFVRNWFFKINKTDNSIFVLLILLLGFAAIFGVLVSTFYI